MSAASARSSHRNKHGRLGTPMDFVPNHTAAEHLYFRDAVPNGEASRSWNYYDREGRGNQTHYFIWSHLPNHNGGSDTMSPLPELTFDIRLPERYGKMSLHCPS